MKGGAGIIEGEGCGCLLFVIYILGMCIAVVVSWEVNHSLLWATVHGLLSWLYIAYHFIF
jgi:hypothetical protein